MHRIAFFRWWTADREERGLFCFDRAGRKLEAALEHFGIDVRGLNILDSGISTGGFTDCLLQRGAASVIGVDVGYGQVHIFLVTPHVFQNLRYQQPQKWILAMASKHLVAFHLIEREEVYKHVVNTLCHGLTGQLSVTYSICHDQQKRNVLGVKHRLTHLPRCTDVSNYFFSISQSH